MLTEDTPTKQLSFELAFTIFRSCTKRREFNVTACRQSLSRINLVVQLVYLLSTSPPCAFNTETWATLADQKDLVKWPRPEAKYLVDRAAQAALLQNIAGGRIE